ncbi:FadR/GntR family transcriptional regulator [Paenibacillus alkalitolerans]|uniref:FadR/GntR family transcriptional regulator n=1 Tax=Paenibacillus alkalitolerans TaxID=2799335 RepID=UPI0018F665A8|nr:FadR/GntR family transcriptional regulator [Paenibacillus alkalitolerans]
MRSEPSKSQKVYQIIFNHIKQSFDNGEFKPGSKLPPERELAARFNVSRTSIREALRVLESNGVVEVRHGDGTFIRSSEIQSVLDSLSESNYKVDEKLLYEMLEVRMVLEAECAYIAAQKATSADLEHMRKCLDEMSKAEHNEELGYITDSQFHFYIAQATHNSVFIKLIQTFREQMKDTIRVCRHYRFKQEGQFQATLNEHKEIYLAIALKDASRAKELMQQHITHIRNEMARVSVEGMDVN